MKKIHIFIPLLCFIQFAKAQIPNPSFEMWNGDDPVDWTTTNTSGDTAVVPTFNSYAGTMALEMKVINLHNSEVGCMISSGYFPVNSAPAALHGWYIAEPVQGDVLQISTVADTNNSSSTGGIGLGALADTTSTYKEFVVDYNYPGVPEADSDSINFTIVNTVGPLHAGTYFIIDDLYFGPDSISTGITGVDGNAFLEQCSPNPASNIANIIYSIANHSTVNLVLYDMVGHQVKTLLDNRQQTPGRYKVPTDVSDLPNGIYLYRLNVNGQSYTQKLVVSK